MTPDTTSIQGLQRWLRASALSLGLLACTAQAEWAATHDFAGARVNHSATLLPGGGLLVAGGDDGDSAIATTALRDGATGQWTTAAPLPEPRSGHTGTLLGNGTVLIAGGLPASGAPLNTALTFDPQDNSFTPTENTMGVRRRYHTATVLADGHVLAVGGQGGAGQAALRSTDIYTPGNRTWTSAGSMPGLGARHHTATLLQNGNVLVVAGMDNGESATANTAIYTPGAGWASAEPLPHDQRRMFHTATLLPDGRVYVAGGEQEDGSVFSTGWLYTPATNTWATAAGSARTRHSATLLPDGRVMLSGGLNASGSPVAVNQYFNPATGSIASSDNLTPARASHTSTLLPGGQVLAVGGQGASDVLTSPQLFTPAPVATVQPAATRAASTDFTATVLADGSVLVAGGPLFGGGYAQPMRYRPTVNDWVSAGTTTVAYRRQHTQTLLADGRVLMAGGMGNSAALDSVEIFDLTTNAWNATPPMTQARSHHTATLLRGGAVLVTGGLAQVAVSSNVAHTEIYHPDSNQWLAAAPMPNPRHRHTATLLPDGRVMVVGGHTDLTMQASTALYDPATNTWTHGPSLNHARASHTATLLPGGRVLVTGGYSASLPRVPITSAEIYEPATHTWRSVSTMSEARVDHTATLLPDGRVMVAGGTGTSGDVRRVEVFDPVRGNWRVLHLLDQGRVQHAAVLLESGDVLLIGGYSPGAGNPDEPVLIDPHPTTRPRPAITNTFTLHDPGAPLQLIGSRFTSDGEAVGGGTQQSAGNLPQVRIERMDGGPVLWLDASMSGHNGYTSRPLPAWLPAGLYQARVFSNAIASGAYTFQLRASELPGAPTDVAAVPGNAQVSITWQHPVSGAEPVSYTVTAQPGSASCTVLYPATGCTVMGLTNGTPYTFIVTANAASGSASAAPTDSVTPVGPPPVLNPPTDVTVTPGNAQVIVSWQAPVTGTPPERYTVAAQPGGAGCTAQAPATNCTVTGLTNGTAYTLIVTAHAAGQSASAPPSASVTPVGPPPVLNPPLGVIAMPGDAQVVVSWQAPATGMPPERYTVAAQPGGAGCTVQAPATSCTVTGLTNGTAYTFIVTAHAAGQSASAPASASVTPTAGAAPGTLRPVPTLSQWGLLLLTSLMLLMGLRRADHA